jgi:hypothetical protein
LQQAAVAEQKALFGQQFALVAVTPAYTVMVTAATTSKAIRAILVFMYS